MTPRPLQLERLESRHLLSAWPAEIGFHKDVFVDGGAALSSLDLRPAVYADDWTHDVLRTSSTSRTQSVIGGNAADLNGVLLFPDGQPRYRVLFVNGGKAGSHGYRLGADGRDAIRDFYSAGGSYTGSCAGAFLAADFSYKYLDIWDGYMGCCGGRGYMSVEFADDADHPFVEILEENTGTTQIKNIRHIGGPIFRESYRHSDTTEFLGNIYYSSATPRNTPYLITDKPTEESGRLVIQPSHPEYYSSGTKMALMRSVIEYAMTGSQDTPDLKGELTTVDDATGRVGDGQYHRYTVDVVPGTDTLSIQLVGNAELFVQSGDYAYNGNSQTTGNVVRIDDPVEGIYHVSVFGNHAIRNGTPYTLTVTDGDIPEPPPVLVEDFNTLPAWEYASTGDGRISVVNGRLRMDDSTRGGYSYNEALWTVDLSGWSSATLSFDHYSLRDEPHYWDGVWINDGSGLVKLPVDLRANGTQTFSLDAFSLGVIQIKFTQYDNYPASTDGREWDNMRLN